MATEELSNNEDDPYKKFAQKEWRNASGCILPENYMKGFDNMPAYIQELIKENDSEKRKEIVEKIDACYKQLFADLEQGLARIKEMQESGDGKKLELSRMLIEREREELEKTRNLINELL